MAVTTGDARPTLAPYRISNLATHDTASVTVTVDSPPHYLVPSDRLVPREHLQPGQQYVRAVVLNELVNAHDVGQAAAGIVCGTGRRCSPNTRSLMLGEPELNAFYPLALTIAWADFVRLWGAQPGGGSDRDHTFFVWVADDIGWNS